MLEGNPRLGGPAATLEFMPGYFTTIANSPGSLEPKIVEDLELERYGLQIRAGPTRRWCIRWTTAASTSAGAIPSANHAQLETFAPGEAARYDAFFAYLQAFADQLGISIFEPPPHRCSSWCAT